MGKWSKLTHLCKMGWSHQLDQDDSCFTSWFWALQITLGLVDILLGPQTQLLSEAARLVTTSMQRHLGPEKAWRNWRWWSSKKKHTFFLSWFHRGESLNNLVSLGGEPGVRGIDQRMQMYGNFPSGGNSNIVYWLIPKLGEINDPVWRLGGKKPSTSNLLKNIS